MVKNRKDIEAEEYLKDWQAFEIAQRKRAFQEEHRRQVREGIVDAEESSFIPREVTQRATFRFKW